MPKDDFDWDKAKQQAAERRRKEQQARDDRIRQQLEDAAEREEMQREVDDDMDADFLDLLGASSIGQLTSTEWDDPEVQAAIDKLKAAENAFIGKERKKKAARKNVLRHKKKIKKKMNKGCAVAALAMIGGATAALSAVAYAGYEVVSRFV